MSLTVAAVEQTIQSALGHEPIEVRRTFDGVLLSYRVACRIVTVLVMPHLVTIVGQRTGQRMSATQLALVPRAFSVVA